VVKIHLEHLEVTDAEFVTGIRNHPSTREFLHNNTEFSVQQYEVWYRDNRPAWFKIIVTDHRESEANTERFLRKINGGTVASLRYEQSQGTPVGYIRTDKDAGDSIEIGMDIHPDHRGRGYAKAAYVELFKYLKKDRYSKATLRVLKKNLVAIKCYSELGFILDDETETDLGMSLNLNTVSIPETPKTIHKIGGQDLKVQILLFYYDRPLMAKKFALRSVFLSTYENWELCIIDDSTNQDANLVLEGYFRSCSEHEIMRSKVKIIKTNDSQEQKRERGNSIFGKFATQASYETDSDISFMLCDDDAILPDYLFKLNEFYKLNPDCVYSYCHVVTYDPTKSKRLEDIKGSSNVECAKQLNKKGIVHNGYGNLDSSQVSWRVPNFVQSRLGFKWPLTKSLDAVLFDSMKNAWGSSSHNHIVGQYKAWFDDQLGKRSGSGFQIGDQDKVWKIKNI
jgi:RimJ/RimL family protein N-acetyltransferase